MLAKERTANGSLAEFFPVDNVLITVALYNREKPGCLLCTLNLLGKDFPRTVHVHPKCKALSMQIMVSVFQV